MSLLVGIQERDRLDSLLTQNLDEMIATLQTAFQAQARGENVPLLLGLQTPEQLDPVVRDELDQILAAIQTAFNSQVYNTFIKGYTEYEIAFVAGDSSKTKTLPAAVVVANTELVYLGLNTAEPSPYAAGTAYFTLTDATTVTGVRRDDLATTTLDLRFGVLEYQPNVLRQAIKYGTILNAAAAGTSTVIREVGPRAKVCFLGYDTDYTGSDANRIQVKLKLTDTTHVTAYRNTGGADGHVTSFCVVDFK